MDGYIGWSTWRRVPAGLLIAVLAVWPAGATEWALVPDSSRVAFEYQRNGRPAEGLFGRFEGEGTFSPEAPESARLELRIDSASIDLGERLASAFATSAEWFDSANHPLVTYRLTSLAALGGDRYDATGDLTIRGRTLPVRSTITLTVNESSAHATGLLELDRRDYGLGVGPTAMFVEIGREVAVQFDLTARPAD